MTLGPYMPRCSDCGVIIATWRFVRCKNPAGHYTKDGIQVTVTCDAETTTGTCRLAAGHHGAHEPGAPA